MGIEKYLNYELDRLVKLMPYNDVVHFCEKIIDEKDVGLDKYSKELLALELEKQIILVVDSYLTKKDKISFFDKLQLEEPLFINNKEYIKKYIRLFLNKREELKEDENLSKIEKYYNNELLNRSKKFTNKMITLPGGTKISGKDIVDRLVQSMSVPKMKKKHKVKKTNKKAPQAGNINVLVTILVGEIVASLAFNVINTSDALGKDVNDKEITVDDDNYAKDDKEIVANVIKKDNLVPAEKSEPNTYLVPQEYMDELGNSINANKEYSENIISSNDIKVNAEKIFNIYGIIPNIDDFKYTKKYDEEENTIYIGKNNKEIKSNIENIKLFLENIYSGYKVDLNGFEGYDIHSTKETDEVLKTKQTFLYYLCKKEGIDFNIAMAIWDRESGGNFNLNGTSNSTEDYGEMQITKANHSNIEAIFGFTTDELKNNWMKNMVSAVFMIKELQINNNNDVAKIFGEYNGGSDWEEKEAARTYSKETIKILNEKYYLNDEDLFNKMEVSNGQSLRG